MNIKEYGKDNKRIVLIIHNDMHQGWDKNEQIKKWGEKYKIVIASLENQDTGVSLSAKITGKYGKYMYAICLFNDEDNIMKEMVREKMLVWDKFIVESKTCPPGSLVEDSFA